MNVFLRWFIMTMVLFLLIKAFQPVILPIMNELAKTPIVQVITDTITQLTPMFLIVVFCYAIIRGVAEDEA